MRVRAHLLAAAVLAAALLASCGGDDDAGGRSSTQPAQAPAPTARPPIVGRGAAGAPPQASRFVRTLNARCRQINRGVQQAGAATALPDVAAAARRERRVLRRLLRAVRSARAPREDRAAMRDYRRALADQILLHQRIERAAQAGDRQALGVGLRHVTFNRVRRTQLARDVGLSSCLYGRP